MIVEGLDGARVTQRCRNLSGLGGKAFRHALPEAGHFEKIAAVIRPEGERLQANAGDQFRGIEHGDQTADPTVSATKLVALISESKVPASVHQPSRCAKVSVPSRM